jgi:Tol biopolymer transport system component
MDVSGSHVHQVTTIPSPANAEAPQWSPDGRRFVLFVDAGNGKDQIAIADADGKNFTAPKLVRGASDQRRASKHLPVLDGDG